MTTQTNIHESMVRLYEAMLTLGRLTRVAGRQSDLARLMNTSPQRVKNWELRGVSQGAQLEIQSRFGINATWIAAGTGEMLVSERDPSHMASQNADDLSPSLNSQKLEGSTQSPKTNGGSSVQSAQVVVLASQDHFVIPQYGAGGSMGHGLLLPEQPGVIERWTVTHEWLDKNARGYTAARNLCIVTGFGPSMRPMFNPGDPLLVDRGITSVPADGIYFFRIGDEGFIKQLQKIPTAKGVVYRAKSANPDYDPFEITADMDFEVLGKVIRVWCGTDF